MSGEELSDECDVLVVLHTRQNSTRVVKSSVTSVMFWLYYIPERTPQEW